jgi:hypothetical protein
MSSALSSICIPAVADDKATEWAAPVYSLNFNSNAAVFGPVVIHPDRKVSTTEVIPSSEITGLENGKKLFRIKFPCCWKVV